MDPEPEGIGALIRKIKEIVRLLTSKNEQSNEPEIKDIERIGQNAIGSIEK